MNSVSSYYFCCSVRNTPCTETNEFSNHHIPGYEYPWLNPDKITCEIGMSSSYGLMETFFSKHFNQMCCVKNNLDLLEWGAALQGCCTARVWGRREGVGHCILLSTRYPEEILGRSVSLLRKCRSKNIRIIIIE